MSAQGKISANKKILYCILNWGLGHATRSIPIIEYLKSEGYEVLIASSGRSKSLLEAEFPEDKIIGLPDYNITYSKYAWWLPFKMIYQMPRLFTNIKREHQIIEKLVKDHAVDLVISDNKFGCYSNKVPSVFLTHQISIQSPIKWLEPIIFKTNHSFIKRYTECWIPDFTDQSLSGKLTDGYIQIPKRFIGPLSRFKNQALDKKYKYCAIISGPEPQRSFFQKEVEEVLSQIKEPSIMICGKPESNSKDRNVNTLVIKDAAFGEDLAKIINQSEILISRAGFSSIMDYSATESNAILIPTPGQTEQEYLGQFLQKHPQFTYSTYLDLEVLKKASFSEPAFNSAAKTDFELISNSVRELVS